jgi:hypothetical protein
MALPDLLSLAADLALRRPFAPWSATSQRAWMAAAATGAP